MFMNNSAKNGPATSEAGKSKKQSIDSFLKKKSFELMIVIFSTMQKRQIHTHLS